MSWTDKKSIEQILKIRDKFNISTFIETGTFKGINAKFHAQNFKNILTCELKDEYFKMAEERLKHYNNVHVYKQSSPEFLKWFIKAYNLEGRQDIVFIYLDAHFYDPTLPSDKKWVVVNELKALAGFKNCVICIHDFDCEGLGHCIYDGEHLGWSLVGKEIIKVNSNFYLYTNTKEFCEIYNKETIANVPGINLDEDVLDNIQYAWTSEAKTYRGILYAVPEKLDLNNFQLIEFNPKD